MYQAFHAFFQLAERTVGDVDHGRFMHTADGVFGLDVLPWGSILLLQAQCDLFLVLVDRENLDFNFLIDLKDFAGVIDAAP